MVFALNSKPLTVQKSADFNHIRNFELKFRNMIITQQMITCVQAFITLFTANRLVVQNIHNKILNYTSIRRARMLTYPVMGFLYIKILIYCDGIEKIDLNNFVNPRDVNGEMIGNICFANFPHKVNPMVKAKLIEENYR